MRRFLNLTMLLALGSCAMSSGNPPAPGFVVFFPERSAALEPAAVDVIGQAASAAKAAPESGVLVRGYTDSAGSRPDDIKLSRDRARAVADGLVADGINPARITQQGRGQTGKDPGVESRRVEISLSK